MINKIKMKLTKIILLYNNKGEVKEWWFRQFKFSYQNYFKEHWKFNCTNSYITIEITSSLKSVTVTTFTLFCNIEIRDITRGAYREQLDNIAAILR